MILATVLVLLDTLVLLLATVFFPPTNPEAYILSMDPRNTFASHWPGMPFQRHSDCRDYLRAGFVESVTKLLIAVGVIPRSVIV